MGTIAFIIMLFGLTIAIFLIDRAVRSKRSGLSPFNEPELGSLFLLCFLLNLACLPYYFGKTRGGGLGVVIGIGAFVGTFVVSFLVSVVVNILTMLVG